MRIIYNFFIHLFHFSASVVSLFNPKIKLFVNGVRSTLKQIKFTEDFGYPIWFHCASLGEFEQARPIIEKIKEQTPNQKILLTFFSPSGYEVRKNYPFADYVMYFPADTVKNARDFIASVKPKMVVFVKYEFWYNILEVLQKKDIPHYFICSIFRNEQYFFKPYGKWAANHLKKVTHFFVQDENSLNLLNQIGIQQVSIAGDTRFDRVTDIAHRSIKSEVAAAFKNNDLLLVAGSTWPEDEKILSAFYSEFCSSNKSKKLKLLLAPHQINESRLSEVEKIFAKEKVVRLSRIHIETVKEFDILIIDNIGLLSSLYRYADYSYIGGGFGAAVHNTLEAAVFGMPLFFGPNHHKFKEIQELIKLNCAHEIKNGNELSEKIQRYISDEETYTNACEKATLFVKHNTGAVNKIIDQLKLY